MAEAQAIAPARIAAAHVLLAVERGTAHADDQLRSARVGALSRQDRDLCTELVLGTLRWQRVLDREIASRLRYPESDMHFLVIIALRLGAYQLLFLDRIPPHAAVNDSVELAKQADGMQMAGLTNAVLRRMLRERARFGALRSDPVAAYPEWLAARWRARFGDQATQAICAWGQQPPPVTLRVPGSAGGESGAFLSMARRLERGGEHTGEFGMADFRIQDEGSQLVGELAGLDAGDAILDACAAPGGKTAILVERNPEAAITAMDVSAARLRIMERRMKWPDGLRFVPADASLLAPGPAYSTILCDMPCSGTGTLGRNPEIRHRLDVSDLARQAERQKAILTAAVGALRPGGRVIYSTCSLEAEENEQVVEAVLGAHPKITVSPMAEVLDSLLARGVLTEPGHEMLRATAVEGAYLRTVPGVLACDGFFAALLTAAG